MLLRLTVVVCLLTAVLTDTRGADRVVVETPQLPGAFPMLLSTVPGAQNIVVIDNKGSKPVEKIAGREFSRLAALAMGRAPLRLEDSLLSQVLDRVTDVVLIGQSGLSDQIVREAGIRFDAVAGTDGSLIRSVEKDGKNYLIIRGEQYVGALYGVYEYFERFCDVGFFPEGDHVSPRDRLPLSDLNVVDRPRFAHRAQHIESRQVNSVMSTYYWTLDEYRNIIDWMVKNKCNMGLPLNSRGPMTNPTSHPNDATFRYVTIERYGLERGYRYLLWHPFDVPSYVNGEHPDMILPKEFNRQADRERYGFADPVDYYYSSGEGGPMEVRIKNAQIVHARDPAARVFQDMWDLTGLSANDFVNKLPEYVAVGELMVFREPAHIAADYYGGREWFLVWFPSLFWGETLGGDIGRIVRIVRDVVQDPKSHKCNGLWPVSEGQYYYNHGFAGFVGQRLAWNAADWPLERLVRRYVELRYEESHRAPLVDAMERLVAWMAHHIPCRPMHMNAPRMYSAVGGWAYSEKLEDYEDNPDLRGVLNTWSQLARELDGNIFFESDLVEIARTYYTQLWAKHFLELRRAGRDAASAVRGKRSFVTYGKKSELFDIDFGQTDNKPAAIELVGNWAIEDGTLVSKSGGKAADIQVTKVADGILRTRPKAPHSQLIAGTAESSDYALRLQFRPQSKDGKLVFFVRGETPEEAITVSFNYGAGEVVVHGSGRELIQQCFGVHRLSGEKDRHDAVVRAAGDSVKFYVDGELVVDYHHNQLWDRRPAEFRNKRWNRGRFGVEVRGPGIAIQRASAWTVDAESKVPVADVEDPAGLKNAANRARKHARVCDTIFSAMNNLLATRPEFSVANYISAEQRAIDPVAWYHFATAIRSDQFLRAYNRNESYEVNELVYRREGKLLADRVLEQIDRKSTEPVGIGDYAFCQGMDSIWKEWVKQPIPQGPKFSGSTTRAIVEGLGRVDQVVE